MNALKLVFLLLRSLFVARAALAAENLALRQQLAVLQSRIIPFGKPEAVLAAELSNRAGRRRGSRFDGLIAATAILAEAEIATANPLDFEVFRFQASAAMTM